MPSFLKHVKVTYDATAPTAGYGDTASLISRTFNDSLAIDPTTKNAADGVVAGSPTMTFTSAAALFTASDVGKYLYITSGDNLGLYRILSRTSATEIAVERNFAANGTAIPFTISSTGNLYPYYWMVLYNGQEIPNRVDEAAGTFAKFYFEVDTSDPAAVTFHIKANQAYHDPNYSGVATVASSFASTDVIHISYLIEV